MGRKDRRKRHQRAHSCFSKLLTPHFRLFRVLPVHWNFPQPERRERRPSEWVSGARRNGVPSVLVSHARQPYWKPDRDREDQQHWGTGLATKWGAGRRVDVRSNDAERRLEIPGNGHYRVMSIDRPNCFIVVLCCCFFLLFCSWHSYRITASMRSHKSVERGKRH